MNLQKLILTKNDCYKKNQWITPKGIMVHSTGANNPTLKRYVGPDDGLLGVNTNNNHWNMGGVGACVHAFIGKLKDGTIATYQTLPWTMRGWHCAGSGNNNLISFEICEDGLNNRTYFNKVYKEAVELCAYLCKEFNLSPNSIICHSEGYAKGVASNHSDVMHWFPKHNKNMNIFRKDVEKEIEKLSKPKGVEETMTEQELKDFIIKTVSEIGKDKECSAWAKNDVIDAMGKGITDGSNPQSYATREQVISMVMRSKKA